MKKIIRIAVILLLLVSLCGCKLVDKLLETNTEEVITPANPHAIAEYGDGFRYFWQKFVIAPWDNSVVLAFDSLKDVSDTEFKVTAYATQEKSFSLTAESILHELTAAEIEEGVEKDTIQERIIVTYDAAQAYSSFSPAALWPDETAELLVDGSTWKMLHIGAKLITVEKLENGKALFFEMTAFSKNEDGTETAHDPMETEEARAEYQKMLRVLVNTVAVPHFDLTEQQKTELLPTSVCFWTEELAMQMPGNTVVSVDETAAEWFAADAETGKKTHYRLEKADPTAPAEAVGSEMGLLAYALSQTTASSGNGTDPLSASFGGPVIPYGAQYLIADFTQKSVYLLSIT